MPTANAVAPPRRQALVNAQIAAALDEMADLLEIGGANPFRVRAYRNAARTVGSLSASVHAMPEAELDDLPGIGADLAGKIRQLATTGTCDLLAQLRKEASPAITELLKIPGLGPHRVAALRKALDITTMDQLQRAAKDGRIRSVRGFGEKLEKEILQATAARVDQARRFKLAEAAPVADALLAGLRAVPGVEQAVAAGSLRRRRDTVGDLDLLVTVRHDNDVVAQFVSQPGVRQVLAHGHTRGSVILDSGMQVDLRVVPRESFGAALQYFTGSKAHNIALRRLGQERGLKINEYGVFRDSQRIAGATEASVYRSVGLPYIEPELREDRGELDAARERRLPRLLELADLRGDLHVHTKESDGRDTLQRMVEAARERGLKYIAITEHSKRLTVARGLDAKRLAQQIDEIDRLNATLDGFTVLKGIEVDILEDGKLDLPDTVLRRLDLVVGAIHHRFDLPRDKQTERLLRAMDNKHFSLLAHPTGRLIDQRAPCDIDLQRVVRHARERGCFIELNSQPDRLDLIDTACQMAKAEGVLVSVDTDAHSGPELDFVRFGVGQARRGWLQKADVLNTRELHELRPLLARTMQV
ncbi:MAG TPA: DNA polymerase/3'-5' exonuclease PolX [Burkholderiaceae bacterium]|nr:DNA polymerase/3'-5' exonuclease PolX [Burkholderiaceae bacterium]